MRHALVWIFLICSIRTGTYASVHYKTRHGWTCQVSDAGCLLTAATGESFAMRFLSKLRYVQADGTHATIHCHK